MNEILALIDQPANVLIHPQKVIEALGMDPDIGIIEVEVIRDRNTHGLQIWYGFLGLDKNGQPHFSEGEFIDFEYSNFAEFVSVGSLLGLRTWLMEQVK